VDEHTRSHVVSDVGSNPGTRLVALDGPRLSRDELAAGYQKAREVLARTPPPDRADGYRIVTVGDGDDVAFTDLARGSRHFLVCGRHRRCDVVLKGDHEISLRHLLLRCAPRSDGTPALEVIDLRAELPSFLHDDEPRRTFVAEGPIALRLGRYVLAAVPHGQALPADVPEPECEARPTRRDDEPSPSKASSSLVTMLPAISQVIELDGSDRDLPARLRVERDGASATVGLDEADLDRGVLVGRSDRCVGGRFRALLSTDISRAHVLILRVDGRLRAFDLCSTNGTRMDDRRIRCVRLPQGRAELRLAGKRGVRLGWRYAPEQS
jgi:hypothetical protein